MTWHPGRNDGGRGPGDLPPRRSPVFADPSGRRSRRMRWAGAGASAVLAACLAVMIAGLLGSPAASLRPGPGRVPGQPAAGGSGSPARAAPTAAAQLPNAPPPRSPLPSPSPAPRATSPVPSTPAPSASPSPAVTNRASKTPPGRNRTRSPRPTPPGHGGA